MTQTDRHTHTHTYVSAQPARGTTRILNGHGSGLDMLPFSQSLASKGYLCRRCSCGSEAAFAGMRWQLKAC